MLSVLSNNSVISVTKQKRLKIWKHESENVQNIKVNIWQYESEKNRVVQSCSFVNHNFIGSES